MIKKIRPIALFLISSLLLTGPVVAQRVNFGIYAGADISIMPLDLGELDFNSKQTVITKGQSVSISLINNETAVLTITGRRDQDITITVSAPTSLDLDSLHIPLNVRYAYSNTGAVSPSQAKQSAVEVPPGFTSITVPMLRRSTGVPAPPPTPIHSGYVAPTGTVYLFIYGLLGPVPSNAVPGYYSGQINIYAEYSVNES